MRITVSAALLLVSVLRSAAAQVSGVVTDLRGEPVEGAAVELWSGSRQTSMHLTDDRGQFRFSIGEAAGAGELLVRRQGYAASRALVQQPSADLVLHLSPAPVELPGVTARASRGRLCPNQEAREARLIWEAVAARYSHALDTLGFGSNFSWDERTVLSERDVGAPPAAALQRGGGVGHPARNHRLLSGAYARRITGEGGYREFGAWYYPLDDIPMHLISDTFGALHSFSLIGRDDSEIVIGFCAAPAMGGGVAHIEGLLRISTGDTLLNEAHVEFRTPSLGEHAGVDLVYAPARASDGRPLPVPASELFWRQPLGRRGIYQRYREYIRWELGSSDSTHISKPQLDYRPQ